MANLEMLNTVKATILINLHFGHMVKFHMYILLINYYNGIHVQFC